MMEDKMNQNKTESNLSKTRRMVLTGLFFAIAILLATLENALPALPVTIQGVKFGLSNIAVMYALFFLGAGPAVAIAVLKAGFVVLTRGLVAGFLSCCGGILSVCVMALLLFFGKERISYLLISVFGAVSHNIGQFIGVSLIYTSLSLWMYLPVLLVSGVLAGAVTSVLLKLILPAFQKLGLR
jgi:heptaprenyl diphosphate synthase